METAKKEIIIAVIIGLFVGGLTTLYTTGTLKRITKLQIFNRNKGSDLTSPIPQAVNNTTKNEMSFLEITPLNDIFPTTSAEISGKTNVNSQVLISSENDDAVVISDNSGSFKQEVTLVPGNNIIRITILTDSNVSKEINTNYFPEKY